MTGNKNQSTFAQQVPGLVPRTGKTLGILLGFVLLLVLLVANAWVTKRQLDVQIADQAWVAHTQQVLFELSQTESLLKDAETGQRGFLYTGDLKYLADYNRAIGQIDSHLDNLTRLTPDNLRQQARIADLRNLTHAKLARACPDNPALSIGQSRRGEGVGHGAVGQGSGS